MLYKFIDAKFQLIVNMVFGVVFLIMVPVSLMTGLKSSVPWLVFLSLWALVASHWSAVLAAYASFEVEKSKNIMQEQLDQSKALEGNQ